MGLLDFIKSPGAMDLAQGLLAAGGPSRMPVGNAQALGQGLQAYQAGQAQRATLERQAEQDAQKKLLQEAQIANYNADSLSKITPPARKIIKGNDGYNYYTDGTRVLPGVVKKTGEKWGSPIEATDENGKAVMVQVSDKGEVRQMKGIGPKAKRGMTVQSDGKGGFSIVTNADLTPEEVKETERDQLYDMELVTRSIDEALSKVTSWTTGLPGAIGSKVPGTKAYDLAGDVKTIQANLGFDRLRQMREASPTGGALGQVSERELDLLVSSRRNLDTAQGKEQVIRNLNDIKKYYDRWKMSVEGKHPDIYKGDAPQEAIDALTANPGLEEQFFNKYGYTPGGNNG